LWPFESIVIAHRNVAYLDELTPAEVSALADIMKRLTTGYDNLFEISFPIRWATCLGHPLLGMVFERSEIV
jgi:galactose-1-phosphate uridylyltransferase